MKRSAKKLALLLLPLLVGSLAAAQEPSLPVKVSENGRYFVGSDNKPLFWLGTTQWELFHGYTQEEAKLIIEKSKSAGFSVIQVMLTGCGDGTEPNVYGQKPWLTNDPLTPNEAYFKNVDAVLQMISDSNLIVVVTVYHQTCRKYITDEKARRWAKWLSRRYRNVPNIVWALVPETKESYLPITRELAAGLHEGGGNHLITVHPDPSPYSSSLLFNEDWLDFNTIQTWNAVKLIYPMVTYDYNLKPTKPVVMAEGAYEAGMEYSFDVTPLWVRRQAYYSYLAGGHHAYGHNDSWRVPLLPTWKQALDAPAVAQMSVLKKTFLARKEWWLLVPDQSLFASGGQISDAALPKIFATSKEQNNYVRGLGPYASGGKPGPNELLHLAARHKDGQWAMFYLADKASFSVNLSKLNGPKLNLFWVNPITGESTPIGQEANTGIKSFSTPNDWEDAILILEAAKTP
jgi:hypothetical protein